MVPKPENPTEGNGACKQPFELPNCRVRDSVHKNLHRKFLRKNFDFSKSHPGSVGKRPPDLISILMSMKGSGDLESAKKSQ